MNPHGACGRPATFDASISVLEHRAGMNGFTEPRSSSWATELAATFSDGSKWEAQGETIFSSAGCKGR